MLAKRLLSYWYFELLNYGIHALNADRLWPWLSHALLSSKMEPTIWLNQVCIKILIASIKVLLKWFNTGDKLTKAAQHYTSSAPEATEIKIYSSPLYSSHCKLRKFLNLILYGADSLNRQSLYIVRRMVHVSRMCLFRCYYPCSFRRCTSWQLPPDHHRSRKWRCNRHWFPASSCRSQWRSRPVHGAADLRLPWPYSGQSQ